MGVDGYTYDTTEIRALCDGMCTDDWTSVAECIEHYACLMLDHYGASHITEMCASKGLNLWQR